MNQKYEYEIITVKSKTFFGIFYYILDGISTKN